MSLMNSPQPPTTTNTNNKKRHPAWNKGQIYESVYRCLKRLNDLTLPQSMNKISQNGNIKIFLSKHNLISEVKPEDNLREEYLTYRYYCISLRGQEYLKRYESFKELIS